MEDYDSLAEELIGNPHMLNEILKREDIDLTTLYYTLEIMHEDIMGDVSEYFSKEEQKRDEIIVGLLYSIESEMSDRGNEELKAKYDVYGLKMTAKQVMEMIRDFSEDELNYYDIIDVIRDNEQVRDLVFSKLTELDPYSNPKYADYKKLLDEINDIRFKQEEEYSEMAQYEADEKAKKEKEKREAEYQQYDEYEEEYEEQTPQEKEYEEYLAAIERCQQKIAEYEELLEDESLDEQEMDKYESLIVSEKIDIEDYTKKAKELQYSIEMARLGTSLTIMAPEEIEEAYIELLEERKSFTHMEEDGIEVSDEALGLNKDKLELIEGFAQSSPEIQALIQAQKEEYDRRAERSKQREKELQESMEYEETLRNAPIGETDLDKMLHRTKTPEELESMSEDELQQIIDNNEQTIEKNNEAIKKALVERILTQQRTISEQQLEISRLESQKKEL